MAVMKPDPVNKLCLAETNSLLSVDALTGGGGVCTAVAPVKNTV
jgi:hypothetical protein